MADRENPKMRLVAGRSHEQLERALGNLMGMQSGAVRVRDLEAPAVSVEPSTDVEPAQIPASNLGPEEEAAEGLLLIDPQLIELPGSSLRENIEGPALEELATSIKSKGIIQPIIARRLDADTEESRLELIAGERRLRAAQIAGLKTVPVIIGDFSDRDALELAIIENAQREDLNPIEEASALKRLGAEFGLNQTEIAETLGKNRTTIANAMRLLQLESEIIELIRGGALSAGHGRALLGIKDSELRLEVAAQAASEGWSVRMTEEAARRIEEHDNEAAAELEEEEPAGIAQLDRLKARVEKLLGLQVSLNLDPQGRKRLQITFESEAAWKRFLSRIRN